MNLALEVDGFDSVTFVELGLPKTVKLNIQQIYKFPSLINPKQQLKLPTPKTQKLEPLFNCVIYSIIFLELKAV